MWWFVVFSFYLNYMYFSFFKRDQGRETQCIWFVLKTWTKYPRIHYVSAYPLQSTLRLFLGEGWSSPFRIRVSAYPLQTTLRLFPGECWSSPLRIHVSAYPLHDQTTLILLFPGKGWSLPLRIHVSTLFREAPLKRQGILQFFFGTAWRRQQSALQFRQDRGLDN